MQKDEKFEGKEIYEVARNIDKYSDEDLDTLQKIEITVNLNIPSEEERKLNQKNLMTPIKEADRLKKVKDMQYYKELLKENKNGKVDDLPEEVEAIIKEGEKAVNELMETFSRSAFALARNWINDDRLNTREDWKQIILTALHKAIMTYSLDKGTQFNTHLGFVIKEQCKDNKHKSSIIATNATAMEKRRQINKIKAQLEVEGKDKEDIYEIAKRMKRDISTEQKFKKFKEMLLDMEYISPASVSTDSKVDDESRTVGEQLASDFASPEEYTFYEETKKKARIFVSELNKEQREILKSYLSGEKNLNKKHNMKKFYRNLATSEFKELLSGITKCSRFGLSLLEFL